MLTKLHYWWQEKRSSFWFVPAVMVLDAVVLGALQTIARQTANPGRRRSVHEKAQWIADPAEHNIESPYDREMFENRLVRVREALETSRCYHKQKNQ